jgi:hypothetical protein
VQIFLNSKGIRPRHNSPGKWAAWFHSLSFTTRVSWYLSFENWKAYVTTGASSPLSMTQEGYIFVCTKLVQLPYIVFHTYTVWAEYLFSSVPLTCAFTLDVFTVLYFNSSWPTGSSKKMNGIWNRYNVKSTRRIYTFGFLKCSEKFKVLDLP